MKHPVLVVVDQYYVAKRILFTINHFVVLNVRVREEETGEKIIKKSFYTEWLSCSHS